MTMIDLPDLTTDDSLSVGEFLRRVFNPEEPLPIAEIGDLDNWYPLLLRAYELLEIWARRDFALVVREKWYEYLNLRADKLFYFSITYPLRSILAARARVAEIIFNKYDPQLLHWRPPPFKARGKIKIAVLLKSFYASPETLAALPFFFNLSPKKFAVSALVSEDFVTPLRAEFAAKYGENSIITLPVEQNAAVAEIRAKNFDLLLIVGNTSSVMNMSFACGMFRVARRQLVMFCQPQTTALPAVDGFLIGKDFRVDPNDFTEKLYYLDGSGICFAKSPLEPRTPAITFTRDFFGIPADALVLVSGANYYKIRAELLDFWARLLRENPRTVLVLFPFSVHWSLNYDRDGFAWRIGKVSVQHEIDPRRFIIVPPMPTRGDIHGLIELADVYLDSFPYSGATSLLDPLALGMPIVTMDARTISGGQGAAILRENNLPELVAADEASYAALVKKLLTDSAYYAAIAEKIRGVTSNSPTIFAMDKFNEKVERVYKKAYGDIR